MASEEKKTIQINPDLFNISGSKKKSTTNTIKQERLRKKKEERKRKKEAMKLVRPNKIKSELLKRIKEHQQKTKLEQQIKKNSEKELSKNELEESLQYMQNLIQKQREHKKKKRKNKTQKRDKYSQYSNHEPLYNVSHNTSNEKLQTHTHNTKPTDNHMKLNNSNNLSNNSDKSVNSIIQNKYISSNNKKIITTNNNYKPLIQSLIRPPISPTKIEHIAQNVENNSHSNNTIKPEKLKIHINKSIQNNSNNVKEQNISSKEQNMKNSNASINSNIQEVDTTKIKNRTTEQIQLYNPPIDPPYGCLKNGTKPTYSQYHKTFKRKHVKPSLQIPKDIKNVLEEQAELHHSRREKLNKIQSQNQTNSNVTKTILNNIQNSRKNVIQNTMGTYSKTKYKKFKVKRIRKTYRVGKQNKKISLLLKNNKTRKRIEYERDLLESTPIFKIKKYLRERNLLKVGSTAPEYILKYMFINSVLSGDVYNKNREILIHNYFAHE
jgi:hypothetical protein